MCVLVNPEEEYLKLLNTTALLQRDKYIQTSATKYF